MENVVIHSDDSSKQFVVGGHTVRRMSVCSVDSIHDVGRECEYNYLTFDTEYYMNQCKGKR